MTFPSDGAEFKLGGASDRLVFMTHPSEPGWTLYTSDLSILENDALRDQFAIRRQLNRARARRRLNWSVLVLVVVAVLGIPVLALTNVPWITAGIAGRIPADWEISLGASTFSQYESENVLVDPPAALEHLDALIEPLIAAAPSDRYEFHVSIAHDSEVNAFALPGGYIVINSGLILAADDADEVLGVLSHEMAHVTEQHGLRMIIGASGAFVLVQALFGDVSGLLAIVVNAAPLLISQSYSRGFESEADEKGFELLDRAGIDPRGMVSFFEKNRHTEEVMLDTIKDEETRGIAENVSEYLSSHPSSDKRIANLEELIAEQDVAEYRNSNDAFLVLKSLVEQFVADNAAVVDEG